MRRWLVTAVFAFVILAMLAPPVLAQAPPPAPKVTITGTFDQVTTAGRNFYDGNFARAGGQPFATIANYKVYYANGDFAGLDLYSTFTPDIKNHLAFVVVEDQLAGGNRSTATTRTSRGEDYAFIISPELTPFKGLDLKPMFSWFHADGLTAGAARRNASNPR